MPPARTVAETLAEAERLLAEQLGLSRREARLEARILACHVLDVETAWLLAHDRDPVEGEHAIHFAGLLGRRLEGEPVAYLLGEREFFGRPFRVTPATLIPRPETEHLVEAALTRGPDNARALDIGTGTGCIAVTLKLERPDWQVTAVDLSPEALAVARDNAARLDADIRYLHSDLFSALSGQTFDLIVSNPPYVAEADPHMAQGDVRFEPPSALTSGVDGLDAIRAIVSRAATHLADGGWLLLEHGWDQGEAVGHLLAETGFSDVFLDRDLAGHARVSGGRKGSATPV